MSEKAHRPVQVDDQSTLSPTYHSFVALGKYDPKQPVTCPALDIGNFSMISQSKNKTSRRISKFVSVKTSSYPSRKSGSGDMSVGNVKLQEHRNPCQLSIVENENCKNEVARSWLAR